MPRVTNLRAQSISGGGMGAELFGDWAKLQRLTEGQAMVVAMAFGRGGAKAADAFNDFIKKEITSNINSYGFAPVSEAYAKRKSALGGNPKELFQLSGSYLNAIVVKKQHKGLYQTFSVGIPSGQPRKQIRGTSGKATSSIDISEYAQILEHGLMSIGVQARPLWKKAFSRDKFGGNMRVRKIITLELIKAYKVLGINAQII